MKNAPLNSGRTRMRLWSCFVLTASDRWCLFPPVPDGRWFDVAAKTYRQVYFDGLKPGWIMDSLGTYSLKAQSVKVPGKPFMITPACRLHSRRACCLAP